MSEPTYRIGQRPARPSNKLGAKKGLGAQKVAVDFSKLEKEAQETHQEKPVATEEELSPEEKAQNYESMQAAYEDLGERQKKEEEKLRSIDPKKAEQMERLGMGFSSKSSSKRPTLGHSATMDMKPIEQINPVSKSRTQDTDLDNDFMSLDIGMGFSGASKYDSTSRSSAKSRDADEFWDAFDLDTKPVDKKPSVIETIESIDMHGPSRREKPESTFKSSISSSSSTSTSRNTSTSRHSSSNYSSTSGSNEAVKKFASAKAISSDQYFGTGRGDSQYETQTQLSRFQGQNSISSDDYFGREKPQPSRLSMLSNNDLPNFYDIKEGVRDGVTKVAGRLSSFATDVMSSLQDK